MNKPMQVLTKAKKLLENTCHRRYGHFGVRNLQKFTKEKLIDDFHFRASRATSFYESRVDGKKPELVSEPMEASDQKNLWGW